jgi:hypothetical protein
MGNNIRSVGSGYSNSGGEVSRPEMTNIMFMADRCQSFQKS